ncbi:DeoR family transcriptional regulator, partial [Candidatus Gracilibacteria bacterium]|nr:DeoR family transcriptional regulator [Candidatus Gracilibacteria bacterium]
MTNNLNQIFDFIKSKTKISYTDILQRFPNIAETTVTRNLNKLQKEGRILKTKIGKNTFYEIIGKDFILEYFNKPFFEREKKEYSFDFLGDYIPNETSFLGEKYEILKREYLDKEILSSYDYKQNLRAIENLLIDLSFSSSKLEGNTYSYLDTEILIKYNNSAEGKTQVETQMILNHKNAIKYIIDNKKEIKLSTQDFQNIHILLGKGLLLEDYLGKIRTSEVSIGGSAYTPLENHFQLKEQFELFLQKLNEIKNPFEQSLFILVFIPYFQIFMDINKRTSRISSNIPLIKNGLIPFSFLQINDRQYINAILAVYELNDVSLLRDMFVENYLLNMKRYI